MNGTNPTSTLKYLNLTTAPAAPEADGTDVGIASALAAATSARLEGEAPRWLTNRVERVDLNSGSPARLFQYFHDTNGPRSRALLQKFDAVAEAFALDDSLLDDLLADAT